MATAKYELQLAREALEEAHAKILRAEEHEIEAYASTARIVRIIKLIRIEIDACAYLLAHLDK